MAMQEETIFTPSEIGFILYCHWCPRKHPGHDDVPAIQESTLRFLDMGLIEEETDHGGYRTTERGKAWVKMICNTQLPRKAWVNDRDEVVSIG